MIRWAGWNGGGSFVCSECGADVLKGVDLDVTPGDMADVATMVNHAVSCEGGKGTFVKAATEVDEMYSSLRKQDSEIVRLKTELIKKSRESERLRSRVEELGEALTLQIAESERLRAELELRAKSAAVTAAEAPDDSTQRGREIARLESALAEANGTLRAVKSERNALMKHLAEALSDSKSQWRPIDTAPTDGSVVVVYLSSSAVRNYPVFDRIGFGFCSPEGSGNWHFQDKASGGSTSRSRGRPTGCRSPRRRRRRSDPLRGSDRDALRRPRVDGREVPRGRRGPLRREGVEDRESRGDRRQVLDPDGGDRVKKRTMRNLREYAARLKAVSAAEEIFASALEVLTGEWEEFPNIQHRAECDRVTLHQAALDWAEGFWDE